jgi:hypothetical protein
VAGLTLQAIREALAAQIRTNVARSVTVFAYDPEARSGHNITIIPAAEYIIFSTIGSNWGTVVNFDIRVEVPGRLADSQIAVDDYLSAGTGNTSSVIDAVHGTLGGLVEDCIVTSVDGSDLTVDPLTVVLHVQVMTSRG